MTFGCKPKLPSWVPLDYNVYEFGMEYLLLLHDHSSLPLAEKDSVNFRFTYYDILSFEFEHHYIRKSEISLVSTKENPCVSYPLEICKVWQYWLWSCQGKDTKLERFLTKNQHTQRKLLNSENWSNGTLSKIGHQKSDRFQ